MFCKSLQLPAIPEDNNSIKAATLARWLTKHIKEHISLHYVSELTAKHTKVLFHCIFVKVEIFDNLTIVTMQSCS